VSCNFNNFVKVKVKEPHNRLGVAPEGSRRFILPDFHDIWHFKVVRSSDPRAGRLYSQEMFLVLIFTRDWVEPRAMVRSEGNMSLKNPVTPWGIDSGTVRLVAQRLNHYATPAPFNNSVTLAKHGVKTHWRWCRCTEICGSDYGK